MEVSTALLLRTPLFRGIPQEALPALLEGLGARKRRCGRGEVVLRRGERADRLGLVLSGTRHIVKEDFWGSRTIVGLARSGEVFAEAYACLGGEPLEVAVLAAAAAMACCVGAGAMAAAGFPWQSVFGQFFGPAAHSQAASLGMPGEGLALTATDNGCTLTLNGALFDGEVLYLPLTLTFENGVPAQGLTYYARGEAPGTVDSGSVPVPAEEASAGNAVNLMCKLSGAGVQSGQTLTWDVSYLYGNRRYAGSGGQAPYTQTEWEQEGRWSFTFTVPQARQAVQLAVPQAAADPATGIAIAQVRLTPMRVSVVFEGLPDDAGVRDALSRAQIVLHMADGGTRTMGTWEDNVRAAEGSIDATASPIGRAYYEVSCEYGELLDPSLISAVEVNGCLIPAE